VGNAPFGGPPDQLTHIPLLFLHNPGSDNGNTSIEQSEHLTSLTSELFNFKPSLLQPSSSQIYRMRLKSALAAVFVLLPAISNCSTLTPPVLPLIVRTPYLSTWLANARDVPWNKWPMFWTGQEIGFSVLASVPQSSQVYPLLGRPQDSLLPVRQGDV